jgi:hypothetical protein
MYASTVLVAIKPAINEINRLSQIPDAAKTFNVHQDDLFTVQYDITGEKQDRVINFTKIPINQELPQKQPLNPSPELYELISIEHRDKKTIRDLIDDYVQKNGIDYVKRNILYANKNAKKNYRAYLEKCLKNDFGLGLQEDKEAEAKVQEAKDRKEKETLEAQRQELAKRKAEIEEIEKYLRLFDVLPVDEQNRLKTTFIKTLKPFEQNRIKKHGGNFGFFTNSEFKDFLKTKLSSVVNPKGC